MSCPTCGHEMKMLATIVWVCRICGTHRYVGVQEDPIVPALVERVRERDWVMADYALRECVYPPEEKKPTPYGNDWGDTETRHD